MLVYIQASIPVALSPRVQSTFAAMTFGHKFTALPKEDEEGPGSLEYRYMEKKLRILSWITGVLGILVAAALTTCAVMHFRRNGRMMIPSAALIPECKLFITRSLKDS
jgi:hypothetical protein